MSHFCKSSLSNLTFVLSASPFYDSRICGLDFVSFFLEPICDGGHQTVTFEDAGAEYGHARTLLLAPVVLFDEQICSECETAG